MRTNPITLARRCKQETATEREQILEESAGESEQLIKHLLNEHYPYYAKANGKDTIHEAKDTIFKHFPECDPSKDTYAGITPHIIEAFKRYVCKLNGISPHYYSQLTSFSVRPTS